MLWAVMLRRSRSAAEALSLSISSFIALILDEDFSACSVSVHEEKGRQLVSGIVAQITQRERFTK